MKNKITPVAPLKNGEVRHFVLTIIICTFAYLQINTSCFAQNLVPNPSFETFSSCPTNLNQVGFATPWIKPTIGTSDYYNICNVSPSTCPFPCSCSGPPVTGVPTNIFGSEAARTGCAYMALYTYNSADQREYIQVQLNTPLADGVSYTISFYASCAAGPLEGGCDYATDDGLSTKLGAYISPTPPSSGSVAALPFTPQVLSTTTIDATAGWTLVSGTFTGTVAGEQYITIGNFFNNASTTVGNGPIGAKGNAYYYIDDVCVTLTTGGTGCGSFGVCATLPITLLSFTANCETPSPSPPQAEGHAVRVAWQTATETNNDYFTVERSADAVSWETAGTVKGAGNSSSTRSYDFMDQLRTPDSELPTLYYRLKQTDFDGKTETFNDKQVAVDVTECAVKVFPNPAGNTLNVPYTAEQDGEITLQVYDVIGKLVKESRVLGIKGNNKFTMDLSTVASGMYVLKIKNSSAKEQNQKFVKQISQ